MDVASRRSKIMKWVEESGDEVLTLLEQIKASEKSDWWSQLSAYQKEMIADGQRDIDAGRVISHEDVMKKHGF